MYSCYFVQYCFPSYIFIWWWHTYFFGCATFSTWETLSLLGVESSFFGNETTVFCIPLIWDTALSEILDEGDSESEGDQEAGSSDEDEEDEEEDEDGKYMTGTLLVIDRL